MESRELILYKAPSPYTFLELCIIKHGTYAEVNAVVIKAFTRSLGIPKFEPSNNNYSSARVDYISVPRGYGKTFHVREMLIHILLTILDVFEFESKLHKELFDLISWWTKKHQLDHNRFLQTLYERLAEQAYTPQEFYDYLKRHK